MTRPTLLMITPHAWPDPTSGAAVSAGDLLRLLAGRDWATHVLCGARQDSGALLDRARLTAMGADPCVERAVAAADRGIQGTLLDFRLGGISATALRSPSNAARSDVERGFLGLIDRALAEARPSAVLTYGGGTIGRTVVARARSAGIPVAFWLRNCNYQSADLFEGVGLVIVPSQFAADHYRANLGLRCEVVPSPIDSSRIVSSDAGHTGARPSGLTFVNPEPDKGAVVFAAIANALAARAAASEPAAALRQIEFLVVEGRRDANELRSLLTPAAAARLHVLRNAYDPRVFLSRSRALVCPSLCPDTFARTAAEAMLCGIPVLASTRGGLPETLGEGGLLFDVPAHVTPQTTTTLPEAEVRGWVEAIERLWNDETFYRYHATRGQDLAQARYRSATLAPRYDHLFSRLAGRAARAQE